MRFTWPIRIALAASVVGNVAGGIVASRYIEERGGLRWLGNHFGLTTAAPKTAQKIYSTRINVHADLPVESGEVIFLGDSLTGNYPWAERFQGIPVRNFGIGADNTGDILTRLHTITARQPDAVFLMAGTNDHVATSEEIAANVREIVTRIQAASPRTAIVLQGLLPESHERARDNRPTNELLEAVATETGAIWLDIHDKFVDPETAQLAERFTTDGIHLTADGYRVWVEHVEPLIYKLHNVQRRVALMSRQRAVSG